MVVLRRLHPFPRHDKPLPRQMIVCWSLTQPQLTDQTSRFFFVFPFSPLPTTSSGIPEVSPPPTSASITKVSPLVSIGDHLRSMARGVGPPATCCCCCCSGCSCRQFCVMLRTCIRQFCVRLRTCYRQFRVMLRTYWFACL